MALSPLDTLINSNYETDQVAKILTGAWTAPDNEGLVSVAHGLDFTPLVGGYWSLTSDFKTSRQFSDAIILPGDSRARYTELYADGTNLYFGTDGEESETRYYRVWAMYPSGLTNVSPILANFLPETLTSKYNYMKLFRRGHVSAGETFAIHHGFGYIPLIRIWSKHASSTVWQLGDPYENVAVDEQDVSFSGGNVDYEYRIYYNAA